MNADDVQVHPLLRDRLHPFHDQLLQHLDRCRSPLQGLKVRDLDSGRVSVIGGPCHKPPQLGSPCLACARLGGTGGLGAAPSCTVLMGSVHHHRSTGSLIPARGPGGRPLHWYGGAVAKGEHPAGNSWSIQLLRRRCVIDHQHRVELVGEHSGLLESEIERTVADGAHRTRR